MNIRNSLAKIIICTGSVCMLTWSYHALAEQTILYTDRFNLGSSRDSVNIESGDLTINSIAIPRPGPVTNCMKALGRPEKVIEQQVDAMDENGNWVMSEQGGSKKKKRIKLLWLAKGISAECEYAKTFEALGHCDEFNLMIRDEFNPHNESMYPGYYHL